MGWATIIELILKFVPTLIKLIMDIIGVAKPAPSADFAAASAPAAVPTGICEGIDQVCAALQDAKAKLLSA